MAEGVNRATLDMAEAAARLGISLRAGYRAAERGELPVVRIGGRVLVLRAPFEKLISGEDLQRSHRAGTDHAA